MPLTIPDQNIALQTQVPDSMKSIGGMLNIASGAEQLQGQRIANQSNQANLNEQNGVRSIMQNIKQYQDPEGNVDFNKFGPDVLKVAPNLGAKIISGVMGAQQDSTSAKQAIAGLNQTYKTQVAQEIGGLAGNGKSPEENLQQLTALGQARPELAPVINYMNKYTIGPAIQSGDPQAIQNAYLHAATSIMGPTEQVNAMTPSGVNVGNGIQTATINTKPTAGPIGQAIPGTTQTQFVPLANQQSTVSDQLGNPYIQNKNAQGVITGVAPMPGQATPGTPGAFPHMNPGQPADIAASQQEVTGVRSAADSVGQQANINQNILRLSKDTASGPGTETWHRILGAVSLGHFGDSYQELGKYLEKNAIQNMTAMGGSPSDARLQAASAANGSTQYNPKPLQEITKYNDAATTALAQYRQGMDKAVGLKNSDYTALPEFKSAWAKNLDPNVFRAENAIRDGDTMELQKLKTELGDKGMKQLAQKRLNLMTLSQTGHIPK